MDPPADAAVLHLASVMITVRALIRERRAKKTRRQDFREVRRQAQAAGLPVPRYRDGTWDRRRNPR